MRAGGGCPAGSSLPIAGLSCCCGRALVGPLASDMSDAAPKSLNAALIDSRLVLMASHASLASRVASIATSASWPIARSLLRAIISFFELPNCFPNPRRTVSLGSVSSLAAANAV